MMKCKLKITETKIVFPKNVGLATWHAFDISKNGNHYTYPQYDTNKLYVMLLENDRFL